MIDKDIQKINKAFKFGKWIFVINIIMSILSIVIVLIDKQITVLDYVAMALNNIVCSLLLAFIFGHTSVSDVSKNEESQL